MMDPITTIGALLSGSEQRDAIHIAVAPVIAAERLAAGQHVGFVDGSMEKVGICDKTIGIVDPFLTNGAPPGSRFWMFLYPNTITSLRHEWFHPAFAQVRPPPPTPAVERIAAVASMCGKTPDALIDDAINHAEGGFSDWIMDNSERYKDVPTEKWEQFWKDLQEVTGKAIEPTSAWDFQGSPYTCSC